MKISYWEPGGPTIAGPNRGGILADSEQKLGPAAKMLVGMQDHTDLPIVAAHMQLQASLGNQQQQNTAIHTTCMCNSNTHIQTKIKG